MKRRRTRFFAVIALLGAGLASPSFCADQPIDITSTIDVVRRIPIAITGFSSEIADVLKFDLEIMGCVLAEGDTAQFEVSGSNSGNVQGLLRDRISKAVLLSRIYQGGSSRSQAHALSDDVITNLFPGMRGIARTQIAFKVQKGNYGDGEIYIADYDGHGAQAVTRDNVLVAAPTWVPGQFRLLYTSYRAANPDLYSHDLTTGERKAVARYSGLNSSAAISPDGRKVAMILSKSGSPDLYVADLDGSNLKQLTTTREEESSPCWSPDGGTLCFVSSLPGRPALYTIPAAGGEMRRLTMAGVSRVSEPDWSPDGKLIAFTAMIRPFQICTVPSSGGTVTVLTGGEDPSWAPNSRTLIFVRTSGDSHVLSLLDVPTKQTKDVARVSGSNSQPAWRR